MEDGRQLVIQAFIQARNSGKSDWYRMTTAVLKNRLLDLTNRKFIEADYGAASLSDFVLKLGDILDMNQDQLPMVVELKPEQKTALDSSVVYDSSKHIRIKAEFWRAIFDRSSGNTYYWLAEIGVVGTSPTEGNCPILPTIDADTDRQWRQSFVESLPDKSEKATEWAESLFPLSQLPLELRYQWNRVLIGHVHRRLLEWFNEQGLEPPSDFITQVVPRKEKRATNLEALRRLIQRVVQQMTEEELAQLSLPARAVLEATTPRRP